ncbi:flavo protein-like protein [Jimgerdemannia flammicorona]|uniref:Cytochrome c oxidase subunit 6, mitochondrial n=1 Tax=Jimgerdemannia flammicorona TaxID=994334 RepID=A0A433CW90_9FUNG|nr:flavo protein-like protein [Jimgerdemannia flammicorona]
MAKIYIIIYSLYGHVLTLARGVAKGLESQGAEVKILRVPETLPAEVLAKMGAPPAPSDIAVANVSDLVEADGILFGFPTRFGEVPQQFKSFFFPPLTCYSFPNRRCSFLDATGQLWSTGALTGKPCGIFTSTATQHGGQETTIFTTITYLAHHGMLYVPLGYANTNLFDISSVNGGSPYGAGAIAGGDGSRQPSETELSVANTQGENFAKLVNALIKGKTVLDPASEPAPIPKAEKKEEPVTRAVVQEEDLPKRRAIGQSSPLRETNTPRCCCHFRGITPHPSSSPLSETEQNTTTKMLRLAFAGAISRATATSRAPAARTAVAYGMTKRAYSSTHEEESFEAFTDRYVKFFEEVDDLFELQRGLNNAFAYDLVPAPSVIEAALNAARRVNDFPTAVRIFEGIKAKVSNDSQYNQYLEELKPLKDQLGVLTREELGY